MRSAQHHGDAARAEMIREFVSAPRRAGDDGQPDQIRIQIERHIGDPFVDERSNLPAHPPAPAPRAS